MKDTDLKNYKKLLEDELKQLTKDLQSISSRSPHNREDWDARFAGHDPSPADPNVAADFIEEYAERAVEADELEARYNEIKDSIYSIENGKYGVCEKCEKEIEKERLDANPAAKTCLEHI